MNIPIPILLVINKCPPKGTSKDDFPFAKVGYVTSLEGTPWKFNIAPEKLSSQKESSFPTIIFQGLC